MELTDNYITNNDIGSIAYYNYGTIENCYNTGTINESYSAGGIAFINHGIITNCHNTGEISGNYVGGVVFDNGSTIENCYYLADDETDELDGTTAKNEEQFASGEVAYLLQGEQEEQVWGQEIGKDPFPQLTTENKVYKIKNICIGYSNDKNAYFEHDFDDNGTCIVCGEVQTTTTTTSTTPISPTKYKLGDVNEDNTVDAVDAAFILHEYALLSTSGIGDFTDSQNKVADVNYDGLIDAVDASLVLQYYAYASTGGEKLPEEFFGLNTEESSSAKNLNETTTSTIFIIPKEVFISETV